MLTLGCGLFYALHIIICEKYSQNNSAVSLTAVQFAASAVICLLGAVFSQPFPTVIPGSAIFSVVYLSVFCTALCFFLQTWGQRYVPSSSAAVLMTLESVFGTLISVIFYREQLTLRIGMGFLLIFISVVLTAVDPSTLRLTRREV